MQESKGHLGICSKILIFGKLKAESIPAPDLFIHITAMKKTPLTLLLLICTLVVVNGQSRLEGVWKGVITQGGLESAEQLPFELYLQKEGGKLVGRSYITLKNKERVEMEVQGTLYGDLSIYLRDTDYVPVPGKEDEKPSYTRKYQLLYLPSIWDTKMEGFWQEITPHDFSEKRKLGRIKLKKMKDPTKA